jgi:hypothetical protein
VVSLGSGHDTQYMLAWLLFCDCFRMGSHSFHSTLYLRKPQNGALPMSLSSSSYRIIVSSKLHILFFFAALGESLPG